MRTVSSSTARLVGSGLSCCSGMSASVNWVVGADISAASAALAKSSSWRRVLSRATASTSALVGQCGLNRNGATAFCSTRLLDGLHRLLHHGFGFTGQLLRSQCAQVGVAHVVHGGLDHAARALLGNQEFVGTLFGAVVGNTKVQHVPAEFGRAQTMAHVGRGRVAAAGRLNTVRCGALDGRVEEIGTGTARVVVAIHVAGAHHQVGQHVVLRGLVQLAIDGNFHLLEAQVQVVLDRTGNRLVQGDGGGDRLLLVKHLDAVGAGAVTHGLVFERGGVEAGAARHDEGGHSQRHGETVQVHGHAQAEPAFAVAADPVASAAQFGFNGCPSLTLGR